MKEDRESSKWWAELEEAEAHEKPSWCCEIMKQINLECIQCEFNNHAEIHRLMFNYCFHCGRKLR